MTDEHEQYLAWAVGHVLGGLDAVDAAAFRSHLPGCQRCRSRVAELRGIAASLDAVERDERSRAPLRTELPRRVERLEDRAPMLGTNGGIAVRHVTLAVILVLALAGATAFWNFHLRTVVATAALAADQREETLVDLAEGVPVEAELSDGLRGLVVVGNGRVAFVLSGLAPMTDGDSLVAKVSGGALRRPEVFRVAGAGQLERDAFFGAAPTQGAQRLTVTREASDGATATLLDAEIRDPRPVGAR